jgi:hypothetical protein
LKSPKSIAPRTFGATVKFLVHPVLRQRKRI